MFIIRLLMYSVLVLFICSTCSENGVVLKIGNTTVFSMRTLFNEDLR